MKENNIVTFLGLMEDDLWNNTDVTEPSFDIALFYLHTPTGAALSVVAACMYFYLSLTEE